VINITQGFAKLLAPYGRANSVSPGAVNTGYWLTAPKVELEETLANKPLGKLIEPLEVANAILYLATDRSASTTGQNLVVNS
jgi:3-oxoacyl-[acyl-carrier protein] reductase